MIKISYYHTQRKALLALETMIKSQKKGIEMNRIYYNLTISYPISEKSIEKRIKLLQDLDLISVKDGVVTWKGGQKNG